VTLRFTSRPLGVLDNIYRFIGGQTGPNEFEDHVAIQPVHDVSREAEVGTAQSSALGFLLMGTVDVHVGIGTIFTSIDVYDEARVTFRELDPEDVDCWIIDGLCTNTDSSDFDQAAIGLQYTALNGAFPTTQEHLLWEYTTPGPALRSGGPATIPQVLNQPRLPKYVPHSSRILARSSADNGGTNTINLFVLLWAGARGTLPPGLS